MTAHQPERRQYDSEILIAIAEIKKDTGQIFDRLNKINGSIIEWNEKKHKLDSNEKEIMKVCEKIIAHEEDHQKLDERYVGFRFFRNSAIIFGLLIATMTILNLFGISI